MSKVRTNRKRNKVRVNHKYTSRRRNGRTRRKYKKHNTRKTKLTKRNYKNNTYTNKKRIIKTHNKGGGGSKIMGGGSKIMMENSKIFFRSANMGKLDLKSNYFVIPYLREKEFAVSHENRPIITTKWLDNVGYGRTGNFNDVLDQKNYDQQKQLGSFI